MLTLCKLFGLFIRYLHVLRKQIIWIFALFIAVSSGNAAGVVPFEMVKGLIIIEATIDNTTGKFIFDTGADQTVLNKRKSAQLGAKISTPTGFVDASERILEEVTIGKISQQNLEAFVLDLANLDNYLGLDIMGILPGSIFSPKYYLIDYQAKVIQILDKCPKELRAQYSHTWDISTRHSVPLVQSELNGKKVYFILDSGATANYLDASVVKNLSGVTYTGNEKEILTAAGSAISKEFILSSLSIKDMTFPDITFQTLDFTEISSTLNKNVVGILSLNKISSNEILVDIKSGKIYF